MKTTGRIFTLLIICLFSLLPKIVLADIHTAATCQNKAGQTDVQTAVNAASSGDVVIVPAGSCTWDTTLLITKGIRLQGAGVGNTVITSNMASTSDVLIQYQPSNILLDEPFNLAGFTFDINNKSVGIWLYNTDTTNGYELHNIKIHHNSFLNGRHPNIAINGQVYGLIYSNTFTSNGGILEYVGGGVGAWNKICVSYGNANALYFEDNTMTIKSDAVGATRGARYVFRYNTITLANDAANTNLLDMHGNQYGDLPGAMQLEAYGNKVIDTASSLLTRFVGQRGGMALSFYNYATTNRADYVGHWVRNEYPETVSPVTNPCTPRLYQYPMNTYIWSNYNAATLLPTLFRYYDYFGTVSSATSNSLTDSTQSWNNFCGSSCATTSYGVHIMSGTGAGQVKVIDSLPSSTKVQLVGTWDIQPTAGSTYEIISDGWGEVAENSQFWTMKSGTFDGTGVIGGGVGCGTLASRPATCTTGVGYWATNQSCSVLTNMIGANPITPISGTLYKCTATNTWTAYYTPYTYPHPLTRPDPPRNIKIQ